MKKRIQLASFDFYDSTGIERHLTKMASKGWRLCNISGWWTYQKIEPQKLKFAVTYFSEASDFDPYPSDNQEIFLDYCESADWQLAASNAAMQIFYTAQADAIPIETDEALKLDKIHHVMKRSVLLNEGILLVLSLLLCISNVRQMFDQPLVRFSDPSHWLLLGVDLLAFLYLLIDIIRYDTWYKCSVKAVKKGGSCCEVRHSKHRALFLLGCLLLALFSQAWLAFLMMLAVTVSLLASYLFSRFVQYHLKKHSAARLENLSCTVLAFIAVFIASIHLFSSAVDQYQLAIKADNQEVREVFDAAGNRLEWLITHDNLPLTVEELMPIQNEGYTYINDQQESFVLAYSRCAQQLPKIYPHEPQLTYEIVDIKADWLYETCLNNLQHIHLNNNAYWQEADASLWQADTVYQLYHNDQPFLNEYIICYKERIVKIEFNWQATMQELQIAAEHLRP